MNGTPRLAAISLSSPAVSNASCPDSTTQGPAITKSGRSRPTSKPHNFMDGLAPVRRFFRFPEGTKPCLCDVLQAFRRRRVQQLRTGVIERSPHEGFEKGMPGARRRSEFGMELAAHEPRMVRELDHFA